jgi:hypothetical protein
MSSAAIYLALLLGGMILGAVVVEWLGCVPAGLPFDPYDLCPDPSPWGNLL